MSLLLSSFPRSTRPWAIVLVAAVAITAGFAARRVLAPSGQATPGDEAGTQRRLEFELALLGGSKVSAQEYDGRVVVIDFWATWCGPCRVQAEILHALQEKYRSQPVSFIAINVGESEELVRDFVAKDPFDYPVLMDPTQAVSNQYGVYALPTVMILDQNQRITFSKMGVSPGTQVGAAINRALASG
ncbi:MAG: TlpA disulfide reductase family protein [Acidobacteria bacterium]|nr:TlpA disulfide reductase family protein [Acidobacteriota bacterium]